MEKNNRPVGRDQHVTGGSGKVEKHGSGLNLGGPQGDNKGRGSSSGGSGRKVATRAGGSSLLIILLVIIFMMFGRGGSSGSSSGGSSSGYTGGATGNYQSQTGSSESSSGGQSGQTGGHSGYYETPSSTTDDTSDTVDTAVASGARERFTKLKGDGTDTATIMVYMCGTDLESRSRMAPMDLSEMIGANIDESKVRVLVYTGGCSNWRNNIVSSSTNQIYQVAAGGLRAIQQNLGSSAMTDERNLGAFIKWCAANYPADRYGLICWDHGGGTLSGYGYDEKYPNSGSITADELPKALAEGGCKFDFIGFDACLMATLETAIACEPYADYLIASEETEPGYGWYYTNWLAQLSQNSSADTLSFGKTLADTFVQDNQQKRGGSTTLSIIDLAELSGTVPESFSKFSAALAQMAGSQNYRQVANARASSREFGTSSGIDQIDLITFCDKLGNTESQQFAEVLRSIVKYNVTSRDMTNSRGVSIYFPYRKMRYVNTILSTYSKMGLDSSYIKACQNFASLAAGGQISAGGSSSPLDQLVGGTAGSSYSSNGSYDLLSELLGSYLSSGGGLAQGRSVGELTADNSSWLDTQLIQDNAQDLAATTLDQSHIVWTEKDGERVMQLSEEEWSLIERLELNLLYDDGEGGYIDLGFDNSYTFNDDGDLIAGWNGTWLALDGQIVPYYLMNAVSGSDGAYAITGGIPALFTEDDGTQTPVRIVVQFTDEDPYGSVLGVVTTQVFSEEEGVTFGKLIPIDDESVAGHTVNFICDYYYADGTFENNYLFGEETTLSADMEISNVALDHPENCRATYRITDLYNNYYWTPAM